MVEGATRPHSAPGARADCALVSEARGPGSSPGGCTMLGGAGVGQRRVVIPESAGSIPVIQPLNRVQTVVRTSLAQPRMSVRLGRKGRRFESVSYCPPGRAHASPSDPVRTRSPGPIGGAPDLVSQESGFESHGDLRGPPMDGRACGPSWQPRRSASQSRALPWTVEPTVLPDSPRRSASQSRALPWTVEPTVLPGRPRRSASQSRALPWTVEPTVLPWPPAPLCFAEPGPPMDGRDLRFSLTACAALLRRAGPSHGRSDLRSSLEARAALLRRAGPSHGRSDLRSSLEARAALLRRAGRYSFAEPGATI